MPLEYFLSEKNEYESLKSARNWGLGLCAIALLGSAAVVPVNKGAAAVGLIVSTAGGFYSLKDSKRLNHLQQMLENCSVYEVESRQDIMTNHLGGMVSQTEAIEPIYQNATLESPFTPQQLNSLTFHHLMILGPTGFGKSTLANYILDHLNGDQIIVDPHATPRTWGQLPVAGQGRNYEEIKTFFDLSLKEMNSRYQRRNNGDTTYPKLYILIDEFPAIAKAIGGDEFKEWVQVMLCEARKVNISLILLSQGKSVKTLGLEGQSELLENLTIIRGKGFATSHARSLKNEELIAWLAQQQRPATIDDDGLIIPDLSNYRPLLNTIPTDESLKLLGGSQNQFLKKSVTQVATGEPLDAPRVEPTEPTKPVELIVNDWTEINPNQKTELLNRISEGQSQNKIMEEFFKVRKGGSIRYRNAKKIYDIISADK
jgi:energy-coupling factor transporter ATP-binding protein EcfA2